MSFATRSLLEQSILSAAEKTLIRQFTSKIDYDIVDNPARVSLTDPTYTSEGQFPYLTLEGCERVKDLLMEFAVALKELK